MKKVLSKEKKENNLSIAKKNARGKNTIRDTGDHVIILNCDKVKLTGNKLNQKIYRHHSGYIGGMKEISAQMLKKIKSLQRWRTRKSSTKTRNMEFLIKGGNINV